MAMMLEQAVLGLRLHLDGREWAAAAGRGGRGGLLVDRLGCQMIAGGRVCRCAIVNQIGLIGQRQLLLLLCRCRLQLQLLQLLCIHGAGGEERWRLQPATHKESKRERVSEWHTD